jgi:uncharacterized membrane protein YraQ (UPF0718 family)
MAAIMQRLLMDQLLSILNDLAINTWRLALDASPWLVVGFIAAGLIKAFVPDHLLTQWIGGRGVSPVLRAAIIGIPLPLCSCGVIPATVGLRRQGASKGTTISFLVATPETGVDSIAISYALLGPFFAIIRPITALLTAIAAGLASEMIGTRSSPNEQPASSPEVPPVPLATCCSESCACDDEESAGQAEQVAGVRQRMASAERGVLEIIDDLAVWMGVGLLLAGIMATAMDPDSLQAWASGLGAMLVAGVSPGVVLVFLLAGPATNISTMVIVAREMGRTTAITYITVLSICTLALGLATDQLVAWLGLDLPAQAADVAHMMPFWLAVTTLIALIVLALRPLRRIVFRV